MLDDGSKPSFYHFEIPLSFIQKTINEYVDKNYKHHVGGRTFVLDPEYLIMADSENEIDFNLKGGVEDDHDLSDYLLSVDSFSTSPGFVKIVEDMKAGKTGSGSYMENGEMYHVSYEALPNFGWSVGMIKSHHDLVEGYVSLDKVQSDILKVILIGVVLALILAVWISRSILTSLSQVRDGAIDISNGNLNLKIDTSGKDEVSELAEAIERMRVSLKAGSDECSKDN